MSKLDSSQEILDQQVTRYKQVLDVMPAGVILLDNRGNIAEANSEAYRLLEQPLENMRWTDVIERAFAPRADDGHEVSLKDGRKVKLATSASSAGQIIVITDMTETRLLQSHISDLQRLSSLGKMIASLAHQIRTPLSSAILYATNLSVPTLTSETRKRFQLKLVDRLHDLEKQVNDMLLFANGGNNNVVSLFPISQLLYHLKPIVDTLIMQQQVNFVIDCIDEDIELLGNVTVLASAISNLIINAIQVSGRMCKVVLNIRKFDKELYLSVIDNGPGIEKNLQKKILEPFFTTRQQGTGLGLSVVQMVCHAHNGRLIVQSEPKKGACFTLCLPLMDSDSVDNKGQRHEATSSVDS